MMLFANVQVSCLIAFIADVTVYYPGYGFVNFATLCGFLHAVFWFVLRLFKTIPRILANYYIVSCCLLLLNI